MPPHRIRIEAGGSLRLPEEVLERRGWKEGTYLEVEEVQEVDATPGKEASGGDSVVLRRIEVDPFAEALRKPDEGAFDRILREQRRSQDEARRAFEERIRTGDVPERRPEDSPDHWR